MSEFLADYSYTYSLYLIPWDHDWQTWQLTNQSGSPLGAKATCEVPGWHAVRRHVRW